MKQLVRIIPYNIRAVNAAILDIAEALSADATRDGGTGVIVATVRVFDNESRVSFAAAAVDELHTRLCIILIEPSLQLSDDGECRTLNYLADSMEQLLENTFIKQPVLAGKRQL